MALPPRAAAVYVLLSQPDTNPGTPRDTGTTLESLISMSVPEPLPPAQLSFYASQRWYQDYPQEVVAKVHLGAVFANKTDPLPYAGAIGARIWMDKFTDNQAIETTYPDNIVYAYDPTPSPGPAEPVPDPNGDVGNGDFDSTTPITAPGQFYYPRWYSDAAYDVTNSGTFEGTVWPKFSTEYIITKDGITTIFPTHIYQIGPWSIDVTVTNYQSKVLNQQTSAYEYYDFTQTTFDYKQTTKLKVYLDADVCGWNQGTMINGTISFQAVEVTTDPIGANQFGVLDLTASHNFGGMMVTTGTSATDAGTATFSVTVDGSYVPVEITIPTQSGAITFINDFSVDSITPPA